MASSTPRASRKARRESDIERSWSVDQVLPRLNPGVYVHVHDVFHPFEYTAQCLREGWSWNEDYLLLAFLQFNSAFEIVMFDDYMTREYREWFAERMPKCLLNTGGNIWLRRNTDVLAGPMDARVGQNAGSFG